MIDKVQEMLQRAGPLTLGLFAPNSRYHGMPTATLQTRAGETVVYLTRRFLPPVDRFTLIRRHEVRETERLDNIAAQHLGDPELYWQICDANGAVLPHELTAVPGRRLRICLPEGIPGTPSLAAV